MRCIGATLEQVQHNLEQASLRLGEVGLEGERGYFIIGGGTEALTMSLADEIIQRWFDADADTKVVVGCVRLSDYHNHFYTIDDVLLVVVTKPHITPIFAQEFEQATGDPVTGARLFEKLLEAAIREVDPRIRYIMPGYESATHWVPTFTDADGYRSGCSPFFVWPTGG